MRKNPSRAVEPRLGWAYVSEARAAAEAVALPDLGPGTVRMLAAGGGAPEPHRLSPVTAWAHLRPRSRPPSFCPVCLEPVTLKLGRRVRHHYAHVPGSTCRAATAEGALHLAAKLRLAQQLRAGGEGLALSRLCRRVPGEAGRERCAPPPLEHWPVAWDEVRVEQALPSVRADLLLLRAGAPVLALEVCASHAVDEEKAGRYRSLGLPWIEVGAAEVVPDGGVAWSRGSALPALGDSAIHPGAWRCPRHEALHRAYLEHQRNGVHRLAWRVVHLYRTDGGRSAGVLRTDALLVWMVERRADGRCVEAWLEREDRDTPLAPPLRVRDRAEAKRRLHAQFRAWLRWTRESRGAVADSPMSWSDGAPPPGRERRRLFPERLLMNPQRGTFEGAPGIPRLAWPLPLFEAAAPHPVFGAAPVFWTDLPVRDLGPLLHAVVPPCWLTLRFHEWGRDGARSARADFSLFHHDGRRWNELRHAAFSHSLDLPPGTGSPRWGELLRAVAGVAAEHAEFLAARRASLAALSRPALAARGG
jgi:hypothetical protein